jgi:hypothetical protein
MIAFVCKMAEPGGGIDSPSGIDSGGSEAIGK